MRIGRQLSIVRLGVLSLLLGLPGLASAELEISQLSYIDRGYMGQQRENLNNLAAIKLGRQFHGDRSNDLSILQALLDQRLVRKDQVQALQAMGVIMGDLLAKELGMDWVVYEDKIGRSRALRYQLTDNFLFPMTMISRRRTVGDTTPINDVYQKAYDIIAPLRQPLPFQ
ncbi:MAG: hypothetical protein ACJAYC_001056 [Halieaceae bacterium]|jgi:hypothetical protein